MRSRSLIERIFVVFDSPDQSKIGAILTLIMFGTIILSCVAFVAETVPEFFVYPEGCGHCRPLTFAEKQNPTLIANRAKLSKVCEGCNPHPPPFFDVIETVCVAIFTFEYAVRLLVIPFCQTSQERRIGFLYIHKGHPIQRGLLRIFDFVKDPLNIIDLIAFLPFYITLIYPAFGAKFAVVRLVRMLRVFLIPEFGHLAEKALVFVGTLKDLAVYFSVFFVFSVGTIVLFASIVYFQESGKWDPASGEHYRSSLYYLEPAQVSPFESIIYTFYWVITTVTSVGYGDVTPTTTVGRAIASVMMYLGVLLISLPITIMGISLADFYFKERHGSERTTRVVNYAAQALHHILMQYQPFYKNKRRAFNSWKYFVRLVQYEMSEKGQTWSALQKAPRMLDEAGINVLELRKRAEVVALVRAEGQKVREMMLRLLREQARLTLQMTIQAVARRRKGRRRSILKGFSMSAPVMAKNLFRGFSMSDVKAKPEEPKISRQRSNSSGGVQRRWSYSSSMGSAQDRDAKESEFVAAANAQIGPNGGQDNTTLAEDELQEQALIDGEQHDQVPAMYAVDTLVDEIIGWDEPRHKTQKPRGQRASRDGEESSDDCEDEDTVHDDNAHPVTNHMREPTELYVDVLERPSDEITQEKYL
eukprot:c20355_g1_i1.p1 GENE.c20355_g1_i1~~c20355_g1_i1.p1  ORF type:complete len:644 (+),score=133.26 c20355_g1_i1:2293-4224(+)